jgi:acyl-CoA thioester hydrolase
LEHQAKMTVRFCETDALGHVNNVSYFIYFEQGRVDLFREIGLNMKASDWHFIKKARLFRTILDINWRLLK